MEEFWLNFKKSLQKWQENSGILGGKFGENLGNLYRDIFLFEIWENNERNLTIPLLYFYNSVFYIWTKTKLRKKNTHKTRR